MEVLLQADFQEVTAAQEVVVEADLLLILFQAAVVATVAFCFIIKIKN
jgi:hypothetical protein